MASMTSYRKVPSFGTMHVTNEDEIYNNMSRREDASSIGRTKMQPEFLAELDQHLLNNDIDELPNEDKADPAEKDNEPKRPAKRCSN